MNSCILLLIFFRLKEVFFITFELIKYLRNDFPSVCGAKMVSKKFVWVSTHEGTQSAFFLSKVVRFYKNYSHLAYSLKTW